MTKSDLTASVADKAGLTKAQAERAVNAVIGAITGALKSGDKVTLVGFGTFSVAGRSARTGRNPRTGASIKIRASKVARFKASKNLKDAL
jgi:DNA-binding protein HU-beta